MSFVPPRPPPPDSEAHGLTASSSPAGRLRALARRILLTCNDPLSDPLSGLARQFVLLDDVFKELLHIDAELHGLPEGQGLKLALQIQAQALAAAIVRSEIGAGTKIRKI